MSDGPFITLPVPSAMPREEDWLNVAREILGLPTCPHLVGDGVCVRCGLTVRDGEGER